MKIEMVDLKDIKPYAGNAKEHPEKQVKQIIDSIQAFGFNDPIAVDENNVLIEGHGRLLAAQKLKMRQIPVIRLHHLSEAQKKAYIIAHNKLTLNTGFDLDLLKTEFLTLQDLDFDLSLTGFREMELTDLFSTPVIPETEPELNESILTVDPNNRKEVICPKCQNSFYVE